jgi:monovalent cation/hydrogen antiporter
MHRLVSLGGNVPDEDQAHVEHYFRYLDLSRTLLDVERKTALRLRDEGRITDEALRELEREQDLNETRLMAAAESRSH